MLFSIILTQKHLQVTLMKNVIRVWECDYLFSKTHILHHLIVYVWQYHSTE